MVKHLIPLYKTEEPTYSVMILPHTRTLPAVKTLVSHMLSIWICSIQHRSGYQHLLILAQGLIFLNDSLFAPSMLPVCKLKLADPKKVSGCQLWDFAFSKVQKKRLTQLERVCVFGGRKDSCSQNFTFSFKPVKLSLPCHPPKQNATKLT